jgi:hypothetical protein
LASTSRTAEAADRAIESLRRIPTVCARMADPYDRRVRWLKIKNPD